MFPVSSARSLHWRLLTCVSMSWHTQEGWKAPLLTFHLHEKNITPTECQALSFILVTALKERVFVKMGTRHREVEDLLPKRWNRAWDGPVWLWVKRQRLSTSELLFSLFWQLTGSVTSNFAGGGDGVTFLQRQDQCVSL